MAWTTQEILVLGWHCQTSEALSVWVYVLTDEEGCVAILTSYKAIGGAVWHGVKGYRNSPYGERRIGGSAMLS